MTTQDIMGRKDIELLVITFYDKVKKDETISNSFADVNWDTHLPVMYDFWENVLFHTGSYSGNPMERHLKVHYKTPLTSKHFEKWLYLFKKTVDELYSGTNATAIKDRAKSIATIMEMKIILPERNIL